ncbi:SH3 domain-containing protein [Limnofasciculus baicalensis]|uniref:SH3 domain-containing protein n=1 Tax=Limnofasciculus baicalensis BBK-W-15 TaxID=2699891 RepID=A0AAE3GQ79_9CYAN|nr:SH3 domain-containing protein [Limnofasciculus baicalensis]MCP2728509.1 SH3 domain-containing protein [Limnofasciculus baicalensis BBK-W-15]
MKKILCIGCLVVALTLNVNTGSANAQQYWIRFLAEMFQEVGPELTRQILLSIFGNSADARSAESSQGSISCEVIDPTGSPLNVRSTPNGSNIVTKLRNGTTVIPYKVAYDAKDRHWILIGDAVHSWGWVFGPYVSCSFD